MKDGLKDPRPVTDKTFKDMCLSNLFSVIISSCPKTTPTWSAQKAFRAPGNSISKGMFEFLLQFMAFPENYRLEGKLEDSFPELMNLLKYPIVIHKRYLQTVGVPHQWPYLLASLDYIKNLIENVSDPYEDILDWISVENRFKHLMGFFFQEFVKFTDKTYTVFLQTGEEEFVEETDILMQNIVQHPNLKEENEKLFEYSKKLEEEVEAAKKKLLERREEKVTQDKELKQYEKQLASLKQLNKTGQERKISMENYKQIDELQKLVQLREQELERQEQLGFNVNQLDAERKTILTKYETMEGRRKELEEETLKLSEMRKEKKDEILKKVSMLEKCIRECFIMTKEEEDVMFALKFDINDGESFDCDVITLKNLVYKQIKPRVERELMEDQATLNNDRLRDLTQKLQVIKNEIISIDELTRKVEEDMLRKKEEHEVYVSHRINQLKNLEGELEMMKKKEESMIARCEEAERNLKELEEKKMKDREEHLKDFEEWAVDFKKQNIKALKMLSSAQVVSIMAILEPCSKLLSFFPPETFNQFKKYTKKQTRNIEKFLSQVAGLDGDSHLATVKFKQINVDLEDKRVQIVHIWKYQSTARTLHHQ
ncbi:hypothetical protein HELRODRAFT_194024 [Helobdella robusta]|uniref:Kinetochore protein NDC80 n=1 Tax=Helobdella robusta TaxID=6412 RepID=T1FVK9_HELRO|nr:hypothetical protein HELRODRAFT_194024 [Helobdella robusta]ESN93686.1 hypothetical protein HELRODRAFT_194024 [Helobdella robusta]